MKKIFNIKNFSGCLTTINNDVLYISDDGAPGTPCRVSSALNFDFKVNNPKSKDIDFVQIDSCVYQAVDGRKCDFSINDDLIVYFVEIKTLRDFTSHWKPNVKKNDALAQIIETIKKIKLRFPGINLINVYGVICLKPDIPIYTHSIQVEDQVRISKLLSETACPNLFVGNEITFNN